MTTPAAAVSGRSLLINWAKSQDDWVCELAVAVLEAGDEPVEAQIEEAYQHLLLEKGLEAGQRPPSPTLVDRGGAAATEKPLTVLGIGCVERVNALATGQTVAFNRKMTVLFGRNGCGKTGYVRILKRLSAVRREERILPDITAAAPITIPPECRVAFALGGTEQPSFQWHGEAGVAPFTRLDIFDAQEAKTYVDDALTYSYTPAEVALFDHLSRALARVREKIDSAKRDKSPGANLFGSQISRDIPFFPTVDGLGASTDLAEFRTLAAVSPEEEAALPGLAETIAALGSQSLQAQLQAAQSDRELYTQAKDVAERLETFDRTAYNTRSTNSPARRSVAETPPKRSSLGTRFPVS